MNEPNIATHNQNRLIIWIRKLLAATEAKIAFKTGLAASLSLVIGMSYSAVFDRPDIVVSGLWCVMASIVVMQAHLGGTYQAAWIRFLGVLIGSIAGAIFIGLIGSGPFSLGISIFFTIVLCALLNIKESFRIAGLSTAIIIIMGGLHPVINPWLFGFYRFIDSCIGILVAVIVAHVIWPNKAIENIRLNITKTLNLLSKYFRLAINLEAKSPTHREISLSLYAEISDLLEENRSYHKEAEIELFNNIALKEHWTLIISQLETIFESINLLEHVPKEALAKIFDDGLAIQLSIVIEKIDQAFQSLEKCLESNATSCNLSSLEQSIKNLNAELIRFRATRTTRKFNMEDVENFFVFFYNLRHIGNALVKMETIVETTQSDSD